MKLNRNMLQILALLTFAFLTTVGAGPGCDCNAHAYNQHTISATDLVNTAK